MTEHPSYDPVMRTKKYRVIFQGKYTDLFNILIFLILKEQNEPLNPFWPSYFKSR